EEKFWGISFESINNISTIKALDIGKKYETYLKRVITRLMKAIKKRIIRLRTRQLFISLHQASFRQGTLLYAVLGVLKVGPFQQGFEVGSIALVLLYFNKIHESAGELAEVANDFVIAKIAVMRMQDILNQVPSIEHSGKKKFP